MATALDDPRASDLLAASPEELDALAGQFQRVAGEARTAIDGLRGAHGDEHWTGAAAAAFRTQLGKLPGDLQGVETSYNETASALRAYARDLGPVKHQFQALAGQLQSTQQKLAGAQSALTSAQGNLSTAKSAPKATSGTPAVKTATTAVHHASNAVGGLQDEISGLNSRGYQLLDEFDTIRRQAVTAVSKAAAVAPQHHSSWFSSVCGAIGDVVKDGGKFLAGMGEDVWNAAKSLPGDVVTVAEHPGDWHDWLKFGQDLGTVAGAIGLVAAVVACPADALGLEATVEVLEDVGEGTEIVGKVSSYQKLGNDAVEEVEGKGSWVDLASDAVGMAGDHVNPGEKDAETAVTTLEGKSKAIDAFKAAKDRGMNNRNALRSLTGDQRQLLRGSTRQLYRPTHLTRLKSDTTARLKSATSHKLRNHAANDVGHHVAEHGIDVGKEKVKAALGEGGGDEA